MSKKIIVLASLLLVLGGVLLWGCRNGYDASQYIPEEIPVSDEGDRELKSIQRKIVDACRKKNFRPLEKYFDISRADREMARYERKSDPVKEQLNLLGRYAQEVKDGNWQTFGLEKNPSVRILRVMTADENLLSIVLVKRKSGYLIRSVKLG